MKFEWDENKRHINEDINYSDIPPLTDEQLSVMRPLREVLPATLPSKKRITIRLDAAIVNWFKNQAPKTGGGNYQAMINMALREYIGRQQVPTEDTLRRVIREELQAVG